MPVEGTIRTPVSSATRCMKRTSRPPNITVGSQIVCTPLPAAAFTESTAAACSSSAVYARGHWSAMDSSRKRTCSWISVTPRSPPSTAPCTVSTAATRSSFRR